MTETVSDIADIEQTNMLTWTAPLHGERNGWHLRLSGGYSRRGNSIYTHRYHGEDIEGDIAYCENIYEMNGHVPTFRTTTATQPTNLHTILTERGYQQSYASHAKTMALTSQTFKVHDDFTGSNQFSMDWLDCYMELNNINPNLKQSHTAILQSMSENVCFGAISNQAIGLAVQHDKTVAFYNIVVNPEARGKGFGRAIMTSLLDWAQQRNIKRATLVVDGANPVANKLYDKLGFKTQYDYWYWKKL